MPKKQTKRNVAQPMTQGIDLNSWLANQSKAFQRKVTQESRKKDKRAS